MQQEWTYKIYQMRKVFIYWRGLHSHAYYIHWSAHLQSIPEYEKWVIFGENWLTTEWYPSRQLVWAIDDACLIALTILVEQRASVIFSRAKDPAIKTSNRFVNLWWINLYVLLGTGIRHIPLPLVNQTRGFITSLCAHLLNILFGRSLWTLVICEKKDANFAHFTSPFPECVDVAAQ